MNHQPPLSAFLGHRGSESHAAVSVSLVADEAGPVALLDRLARSAGEDAAESGRADVFLFERVEGGSRVDRWSYFGAGRFERFEVRGGAGVWIRDGATSPEHITDPLDALRSRVAGLSVWTPGRLPPFHGGLVGYLGFDAIACFEDLPLPPGPGLGLPDAVWMLVDEVWAFDHATRTLQGVVLAPLAGDTAGRAAAHAAACARLDGGLGRMRRRTDRMRPSLDLATGVVPVQGETTGAPTVSALRANRSPADFQAAVVRAREAISAGEIFQVVVSQRFTVDVVVDPLDLYRAYRALNPSPYHFYLDLGGYQLVGASPEVLVRVRDSAVLVRPIAGTRRRGLTAAADRALEAELLADAKELAEHRMLVDLGRNDVGRVAAIGSVRVVDPLHIERFSHVMHIVTDVEGSLAADSDAFDALRAAFPAGTVSGAPKIRACELLAELEPDRRGPYAGAVGWIGLNGDLDTSIAIRTAVVTPGAVHLQAGAGIVFDSNPLREHEECREKAAAALRAIDVAHAGALSAVASDRAGGPE